MYVVFLDGHVDYDYSNPNYESCGRHNSPSLTYVVYVYAVHDDGTMCKDHMVDLGSCGNIFLRQENFNVRSPNVYYYTTEEYHGDAISAYFIFPDGSPRRLNLNITNSYGNLSAS